MRYVKTVTMDELGQMNRDTVPHRVAAGACECSCGVKTAAPELALLHLADGLHGAARRHLLQGTGLSRG